MPNAENTSSAICIWSAQYKPHVGGVEQYTENLAHSLAKRGHQVVVVTSGQPGLFAEETDEQGVRIVRLPAFQLMNGRLPVPRRNAEYKRLLLSLEQIPFSGVLVNTRFYGHSLEGLKFARAIGVRPVLLDHGSAYLTLGNPLADAAIKEYENHVTAQGKKYNPRYFGISQASCNWLKTFQIDAEGVLGNSIDAQKFRDLASSRDFTRELGLEPGAKLVAFVGRLSPEKGIVPLCQAASLLKDDGISVITAGGGELFDRIKKEAPSNFFCTGPLSPADVSALLQQAHVFCLPSRSEGFCTALLEAAACGCFPVITPVGGTDELIPSSEYGTILPSANPEVIAQAIKDAFVKIESGSVTREAIKSRVEEGFSWDKAAQSVEQALALS